MKSLPSMVLLILFVSVFSDAYNQIWKQYADSAKSYEEQKKIDKAIAFYIKAKDELSKDSSITNTYSKICTALAFSYMNVNKYEQAEPLFLDAKQINEKVLGVEHLIYSMNCNNLGLYYWKTGQLEKAVTFLLEAKQVREKVLGTEHPDYGSSCSNLAILYRDLGQYEKAEPLYLEAKKIQEKVWGKDHIEYANVCNNLAVLYGTMGQNERAELLFLESKQIVENVLGKEQFDYAQSCNNLGILYKDMNQYRKSEVFSLEAKKIFANVLGKEHPDYAKSCNNLAILYRDMGQFDKAESLFLEAKQIREKALGLYHPDYAQTCNSLAALYLLMEKNQMAESLFLEAKQIREKVLGKEHSAYALSCRSLANLYWNLKEPEKAYSLYIEAFKCQNNLLAKVFQFTSESEKLSYIKKKADLANHFFSFTTSFNRHSNQVLSYDVALSSRNLIMSSSGQLRQAIYATPDTVIKSKYNKWIDVRKQLAFWYSKPASKRPTYVSGLEEQANMLEKELSRISAAFKNDQKKSRLTWEDIHQQLNPHEAAIEFISFHYYNGKRFTDSTYYIALLLRKDQPEPELIFLFEERQLLKLVRAGNTLNTVAFLYSPRNNNCAAYNLIWQPIEKQLQGITKIYFAPAGLLHRVSFAALPLNDQQLLCDKYQLVQLNTTAGIVNQSDRFIEFADKIHLFGGIQYDVDSTILKQSFIAYHESGSEITRFLSDDINRGSIWKYLPGTEREVNEIDALGKQKNYSLVLAIGASASEESIKALNGTTSPAVLHIATHGFFFPDPKEERKDAMESMNSGSTFRQSDDPLFRSGLLFAGANNAWQGRPVEGVEDGILTAYEVSNLYLPNTKLVVLSACETGLGEIQGNEGVYGLQRAFKMAGVENLVMSLWKIPDQVAAEFMQEFYKEIFNKQSIQNAFYKAQAVMKNRYRKEPYKWAAWILVR